MSASVYWNRSANVTIGNPLSQGAKKEFRPRMKGDNRPSTGSFCRTADAVYHIYITAQASGDADVFQRPPFRAPVPGGSPRPSPVIGWMGRGPPPFFDKLLVFASALCYTVK